MVRFDTEKARQTPLWRFLVLIFRSKAILLPMLDTHSPQKTQTQLDELSRHLEARREAILQAWRDSISQISTLGIATSLTRLQFDDHIPVVLAILGDKLSLPPEQDDALLRQQERKEIAEHGLQRWQQGYGLRDLTREWSCLQRCSMEELESYALAHPDLEPNVMPAARRALSELCWDGISDSTTQFWRLDQAEAAGRLRELEAALSTLNELERARAENWREAAHDLRGSLTVVKSATAMLQEDGVTEPVRVRFFDLLQRGVSSLHEMLEDLMNLARLEAGHEQRIVAPFDAGVLLADFCTSNLPLAQARGLTLEMRGPASLMVEGDRAKIQRIVQNLLLNALKYTRKGGVTVTWSAGEDLDSRDWTFSVQDTGPGLETGASAPLARQISEATQITQKINHAELQGQEEGHISVAATAPAQGESLAPTLQPGEGVGLSIVKRLCELLDASLELETTPGKGSTFRVIAPSRYNYDATEK